MAGGTFLRFQVGGTGGSSEHVRYISRPAAVRDGKEGTLLYHLFDAERETNFVLLRDHLIAYAWLKEREEMRSGRGSRTFYHAILGFEQEVEGKIALHLVEEWLLAAFPSAEAVAFLHQDTARLHAHVWMNARDIHGKKLQMDYSHYRSLDEVWNSLYARAMGHAIDEHLAKKNETRWAHWLSLPSPERVGYSPERAWYRDQEQRNAGQKVLAHEFTQGGSGGLESAIANRATEVAGREREIPPGESEAERSTRTIHTTEQTVERAVFEIDRLRDAATNLGSREQKQVDKIFER